MKRIALYVAGLLLVAIALAAIAATGMQNRIPQARTTFSDVAVTEQTSSIAQNFPGIQHNSAAPAAAIVEVDQAAVAAQLARLRSQGDVAKRLLIGVSVDAPAIKPENWQRLESTDGHGSWRLTIRSAGATFLRPHFVALPENQGSSTIVYGTENAASARAIEPGTQWGPLVQGDVLHVEILGDAAAPPALSIDRLSHGLVELNVDQHAGDKESWCYLDPTCHNDYAAIKSAVGQMTFESDGGAYVCSGTLLSDTARTGRPWFITANHCISSESEANSLVVTWNFSTTSCNGAPPDFYSLPYSAGAALKWTNATYDTTLLLLDQSPPSGAAFLGWNTAQAADGESIGVLHHPDGGYLRVSFGSVIDTYSDFTEVRYSQSSTEGGSSGSALLNSSLQVIGALSGGDASCNHMSGTDDFGNFASAYDAGLDEFLDNGSADDDDADDDSADRECETVCGRLDQCGLARELGIDSTSECLEICKDFKESVYECIMTARDCADIEQCVGLDDGAGGSDISDGCGCGLP